MKRFRVRALQRVASYEVGTILNLPEATARAWVREGLGVIVGEIPAIETTAVRPAATAAMPAPERAAVAPPTIVAAKRIRRPPRAPR